MASVCAHTTQKLERLFGLKPEHDIPTDKGNRERESASPHRSVSMYSGQ